MAVVNLDTATARAGRLIRNQTSARRVAQLGGATNLGDCLTALRYLARPSELVDGPSIVEFEQAFARRINSRYAISFWAGRVGLYGLLGALGIGHGDEVLLQVPTHVVVPNAIRYAGATPVYIDCRLDDYNIDLSLAERLITPRTKLLLIQHTFGIPVDLEAALALAQRHNLIVIEDCVHALGATYHGRPVGSFGRAAFFSTEETKIISTTMGGMVTTDDPDLATRLRRFQQVAHPPSRSLTARYLLKLVLYHLWTEPHLHRLTRAAYEWSGRRNPLPRPTAREELLGARPADYERRFSNAQAALGLRQLRRLDANLAHRRKLAALYRTRLEAAGIATPSVPASSDPAYVRFPVWAPDRNATMRAAAPHAVLGNWFTSVLEEAATPKHGGYRMGSCPNAEAAATHLVNLPTHQRVRQVDADAIVSAIVPTIGGSNSRACMTGIQGSQGG